MDTAVERAPGPASSAVEGGFERSSVLTYTLLVLVGGLTAAAVLVGGGSSDERLFWIGTTAALAACGVLCAVLAGLAPRPRLTGAGWAFVGTFGLLVGLSALSIRWSIMPDRSWAYANRGFTYLAFLVLGLLVGGLVRKAPSGVAGLLAMVFATAIAWGLAGKIAPGLFPDGGRLSRLRSPVEYWNALSFLCAMSMPLALWAATVEGRRRRARGAGAVLFYAAVVASLLTYSRGGIVVAAVAVVAWLVMTPRRAESVATLVVAAPVALLVSAWAFRQPGITDDFQPYETRVRDGWEFGIVLGVGGALVWALFAEALRRGWIPRAQARVGHVLSARRLAVVLGAVVAAVVLVLAVSASGWLTRQLNEFESPTSAQVAQDPSRLAELNSNNRWSWWKQAWGSFTEEPLTGTGAATFELVNLERRANSLSTTSPHNVPLQFLSELGLGGFVLLLAAVGFGIAAVRQGLARLEGPERLAGLALAAGLVAYLVHWVVDKDWDYLAVNAPVLVAAGMLASSGLKAASRKRNLLAVLAVLAVTWAALYSLAAPWLSSRLVDRAYGLLDSSAVSPAQLEENVGEALRLAKRARSLDPYSLEPLFVQAAALDVAGIETEAHKVLYRAIRVQPENPRAWYALGSFEFEGQRNNAFNHLNRAYELDPYGPAGPKLDELRAIFEAEKEKCFAAGTC
jgi:hypothetical protein